MPEIVFNILYSLIAVLFVVAIFRFVVISVMQSNQRKYQKKIESVLLKVTIFKNNEKGPLAMEQVYSTLHGILENISIFQKLSGKVQDAISFEIANIDNKIQFYIWMPKHHQSFVEGQIYAQYPEVEIEVCKDYVETFLEKNSKQQKNIVTAELDLVDSYIFPIKRYAQFEDRLAGIAVDPLAGVTAAISKIHHVDEQVWLQFIVKPIDSKWRKLGMKKWMIMKKLFSRGLFKNNFWLQGKAQSLYSLQSFWKKLFLFPIFLLLWVYRGGGGGGDDSSGGDSDEVQDEVSRSRESETTEGALVSKLSQLGFEVNIRMVYIPTDENKHHGVTQLKNIAGSFKQFTLPQLNGFTLRSINKLNPHIFKRYCQRSVIHPFILSVEELATVYHFPNNLVQTPNIQWVTSKRLEPPVELPEPHLVPPEEFTMLGATNFRGHHKKFGIKIDDRRRHTYIIGKTGMGKSTLLENMIFSDIQNGKGLAVIDPHGDLAEAVINFVPPHRTNDVVIFNPSDRDFPVAFNMLECKTPEHRTLVASGLLGVFKKMYADSWGPRLEHILRNTLLALIEYPNTTMLGILRMLTDKSFRKKVINKVSDPVVKSFWIDEFEKMQDRQRTEAISPIQNKVGQFLSSPIIRNIVGQPKSAIDIRFAMDKKKIFVVNLSKGKIGEDNSGLLGAMMITKFQLDAMSRADIDEKDRKDFYLYVDEFQNFATDSFATILSEARKYRLNLVMANQYIAQMPETVCNAVFGNVGSLITFQVGFDDAEYLANQFSNQVTSDDIVALPKYNIYTKVMVDGMSTKAFSASTLPPPDFEINKEQSEKIIKVARERYSNPREKVEEKIQKWADSAGGQPQPKKENADKKVNPQGKNNPQKNHTTKNHEKAPLENNKSVKNNSQSKNGYKGQKSGTQKTGHKPKNFHSKKSNHHNKNGDSKGNTFVKK